MWQKEIACSQDRAGPAVTHMARTFCQMPFHPIITSDTRVPPTGEVHSGLTRHVRAHVRKKLPNRRAAEYWLRPNCLEGFQVTSMLNLLWRKAPLGLIGEASTRWIMHADKQYANVRALSKHQAVSEEPLRVITESKAKPPVGQPSVSKSPP